MPAGAPNAPSKPDGSRRMRSSPATALDREGELGCTAYELCVARRTTPNITRSSKRCHGSRLVTGLRIDDVSKRAILDEVV